MIGRRQDTKRFGRFWIWFASRSQGFANDLEALMRGEADATDALDALAARLRLIDPALSGDIARTLDGACELRLTGPTAAVLDLIASAPPLRGWRFVEHTPDRDPRRAPWRVAPRPTLDLPLDLAEAPITSVHEAWA